MSVLMPLRYFTMCEFLTESELPSAFIYLCLVITHNGIVFSWLYMDFLSQSAL